jgi:hypothetical protein
MYKEIDMQRERIQTIEEGLKELLNKNIEDMTSDDDELSLPPVPTIIPIQEKMGIKIELPNKILDNKDNKKQDTVLKTHSEESLKKDDKLLDTDNKHLEIYSNDNENAQETTISDSLIKQKTNVNIDLDSSTEIISSESEESSSSMNESSNSIKLEKIDLKNDEKIRESSSSNSSEKKDELNEVLKKLKLEEINVEDEKEQKLDLPNLLKLKLPEIQEMAKKENISLDKKINGVNKKKTKQELAEELVNKKN